MLRVVNYIKKLKKYSTAYYTARVKTVSALLL